MIAKRIAPLMALLSGRSRVAEPGQNRRALRREPLSPEERRVVAQDVRQRKCGAMVHIFPAGNEVELEEFFRKPEQLPDYGGVGICAIAQRVLKQHIVGKKVLVVPSFASSVFSFKELGAREVVGADICQRTLSWLRAIANYFHHNLIGRLYQDGAQEMIEAGYEARLVLLEQKAAELGERVANREAIVSKLLRQAVARKAPEQPLEGVRFVEAGIGSARPSLVSLLKKENGSFDFVYCPHLLGEENGITSPNELKAAFRDLAAMGRKGALVMIGPFRKEWAQMLGKGLRLESSFIIRGNTRTALLRVL